MFVADTGRYYEEPVEGTSGLKMSIKQENQCRLILECFTMLYDYIDIKYQYSYSHKGYS